MLVVEVPVLSHRDFTDVESWHQPHSRPEPAAAAQRTLCIQRHIHSAITSIVMSEETAPEAGDGAPQARHVVYCGGARVPEDLEET